MAELKRCPCLLPMIVFIVMSFGRPGLVRAQPALEIRPEPGFVADDGVRSGKKVAVVPVPRQCIEYADTGDEFRFKDTRGRKRKFIVVEKDSKGLILESHKRAYIATGTKLRLNRKESGEKLKFRVGNLPPIEQPIILRVGDTLILERGNAPGEPAHVDRDGLVLKPAHVTCRPSEIFRQISVGAPVRLNDGKIEAMVTTASPDALEIEITRSKVSGSRLRSNRSINFPGSDLRYQGLTDEDRENLAFIVEHADAVCLSFVRKPDDINALQEELRNYPDCGLGIIPPKSRK